MKKMNQEKTQIITINLLHQLGFQIPQQTLLPLQHTYWPSTKEWNFVETLGLCDNQKKIQEYISYTSNLLGIKLASGNI